MFATKPSKVKALGKAFAIFTKTIVQMNDISASYDSKNYVLKDIRMSVDRGSNYAIVGQSGSGKSTLLNMIGLLDRPSDGRVLVDGIDTSDLTDNEISAFRNEKLGFVIQFSNLLAELTELENVLLPSQIQFDSPPNDKAKEILEKVGLIDQLF